MVTITTKNFMDINDLNQLPLNKPNEYFKIKTYADGCGACEKSFEDTENVVCDLMEKKGNKCFGLNARNKNAQKMLAQLGQKPVFPQDLFCKTGDVKDEKTGFYKTDCIHNVGYVPKDPMVEALKKLGGYI